MVVSGKVDSDPGFGSATTVHVAATSAKLDAASQSSKPLARCAMTSSASVANARCIVL